MTCDGGVVLQALNNRRLVAQCGAWVAARPPSYETPKPCPWRVFYEDGELPASEVDELIAQHDRACPGMPT